MKLLEEDIRKTRPLLCRVEEEYASYLHNIDSRVSEKWTRRSYVGLAVIINGYSYVVPLTSQTTQKRVNRGKKKRSPQLTTYIKSRGVEIANLLHNNMFPVPDSAIIPIAINSQIDAYLMNELRYIRKHWVDINIKSIDVYIKRGDRSSPNIAFLEKTCCDFRKLEKACDEWTASR